MSDDRDNVVHIGKSRGGGGGGIGSYGTVLKTNAALNAAKRTGTVNAFKKVGSANSV
jgi:Multiprotein bridging factor 1